MTVCLSAAPVLPPCLACLSAVSSQSYLRVHTATSETKPELEITLNTPGNPPCRHYRGVRASRMTLTVFDMVFRKQIVQGLGCVFCFVLDMLFTRQIVQGLGCVSCLVLDMFFTRQVVHGLDFCSFWF